MWIIIINATFVVPACSVLLLPSPFTPPSPPTSSPRLLLIMLRLSQRGFAFTINYFLFVFLANVSFV